MRPTRLLFAGAALLAAACSDRSTPVSPTALSESPRTNITSETSTDLWRSVVTGETGPGSLYAMFVPRVWNGEAVFFAHGIRDVLDPVGLQDQDYYAVRDELGARGYAIAYSSFSENGYDVADAAAARTSCGGCSFPASGALRTAISTGTRSARSPS